VYLGTGSALRLGAQRGYGHPILEFDLEVGIIGRVARTRRAVFAPDVTREPEYAQADPDVVSEISVPLLADDALLGVLNVESTAAERLDRDDLASLVMIADRLSASIALGRERQELAERSALLGRLTEAFARLGAMLDPAPLQSAVATAATTVVACDIGVLALVEGPSGAIRVAAAVGADSMLGMQIDPGEGATGTAIATRAAVLDDRFDHARYPRAARRAVTDPTVAVMAIPLLREDKVLGALTFIRRGPSQGFSDQEREIAGLLAAQAALAITNANLHSETREAAIRDPLTQLHNRRLLDDALTRMSAARARQEPEERRPVAAILFDLDHFGDSTTAMATWPATRSCGLRGSCRSLPIVRPRSAATAARSSSSSSTVRRAMTRFARPRRSDSPSVTWRSRSRVGRPFERPSRPGAPPSIPALPAWTSWSRSPTSAWRWRRREAGTRSSPPDPTSACLR
jgi:GAF domain-containing protein